MDEDIQWSRRYAKHLEDQFSNEFSDDGSIAYNRGDEYKLMRDRKIMRYLEFLHTQLRPLMDTYVVSALCLSRLVGRQVTERDYAQEVLAEMKYRVQRGLLLYGESVAVDPIKASFKLFEHWQVLECHSEERVKLYYLSETYDKESEINKVFKLLNKFKWGPKCDNKVFCKED